MKTKYLFLIPLFVLILVGVFALGFPVNNPSNNVADTIEYHSMVCTRITRADGTVIPNGCSSNVLYNTGKNLIRTYLGDTGGGTDEVDQISLCNATNSGCGVPVAAKTEDFTAHTTCGLAEATGAYTALAQDGNFTISYEFTSTCDNVKTNFTRLGNTNNDDFAGNNFANTTLMQNDKLSVNWTIWSS